MAEDQYDCIRALKAKTGQGKPYIQGSMSTRSAVLPHTVYVEALASNNAVSSYSPRAVLDPRYSSHRSTP